MHGYAIMQNIDRLSKGRVMLGAGTLYGAINTLVERGWITGVSGIRDTRKKDYIITDSGRSAVTREIDRLVELLENGKNIARGDYNENNH